MLLSNSTTLAAAVLLALVTASCNCASSESLTACESLVSEILRIQDLRVAQMEEVGLVLSSYADGDTDRTLMLERSTQWQKNEAELGTQASQLYLQAREADCL